MKRYWRGQAFSFVAGPLVVNLIVAGILGYSLCASYDQYQRGAERATQNLVRVLEENILGTVHTVEAVLSAVAREHLRLGAPKAAKPQELGGDIRQLLVDAPYLDDIRIADARGVVIGGVGADPAMAVNIADERYFTLLRDHPELSLSVSQPRKSLSGNQWTLIFAERMTGKDGSFAGIVYAPVALTKFADFASLDVGRKGLISLRSSDLLILAESPASSAHVVGNRADSRELQKRIAAGASSGTYFTAATFDGVPRRLAFRKVPDHPFYVIVGLAEEEYLAEWRRQARAFAALMVVFAMSTTLLSWRLYKMRRRHREAAWALAAEERARYQSDQRLRIMTDSIQDYALFTLDLDGRVTSWNRGAHDIKGYEAAEILGKSVDCFYTQADVLSGKPAELLRRAKEEGHCEEQGWRVRKDGTKFYAAVTITALKDETGALIGYAKITRDITARRRADQDLRQSEAMLRTILDNVDAYIYLKNPEGKYLFANKKVRDLWGRGMDEILGFDDEEFFDAPSAARIRANDSLVLRSGEVQRSEEINTLGDGSGTTTYLSVKLPLWKEDGAIYALCGVSTDISELKRAEENLRTINERLEAAASAGIVGVWDWDVVHDNLFWDKVMYQLYGRREDDFSGAYEAWASALHPEDKAHVEAEIQSALRGEREYAPEFRVVWPDGSVHTLKARSRTSFDANGKPLRMVGVNYDLTEQKQIQSTLDQMAFYDRLTGLPNRRLLEDRLEQLLAMAERDGEKLALLFIDLDKFKPVNDELGHAAGDWLLMRVAERMKDCLRKSDTIARIGGDEFVALIPQLETAGQALSVAEKIRLSLLSPFVSPERQTIHISSSIGVAIYPDHAGSSGDLLRFGDEAMYRVKKTSRNAVSLFESERA